MLVYNFLNATFGLDNIQKRRLKISTIMELNDPFEFFAVDLGDRQFRQVLKNTKAELSNSKGILCFSKTWRNPVLWGHYADKHKGLCLGFEFPNSLLTKVVYQDERFPVPEKLDEDFMKKILFTKFKHWEYEQEYRIYTSLNEKDGDFYFAYFSSQMKLKRVIVGEQSTISRGQISEALGDLQKEVKTFKSRPAFKTFEVVRQRNSAMWS